MQLNKVLKSLLVVLPVLAMTACSSSDDAANAAGSESNLNGADGTWASGIDGSGQFTEEELREQARLLEAQTVYFAFDNSTIASSYKDMLMTHAAYLSKNSTQHVTIEGHADERGTPEYNIALGERRAQAVAKYLQALGVQNNQISIVSYGEEKPLVLGQSESAYSKNRRAVLSY